MHARKTAWTHLQRTSGCAIPKRDPISTPPHHRNNHLRKSPPYNIPAVHPGDTLPKNPFHLLRRTTSSIDAVFSRLQLLLARAIVFPARKVVFYRFVSSPLSGNRWARYIYFFSVVLYTVSTHSIFRPTARKRERDIHQADAKHRKTVKTSHTFHCPSNRNNQQVQILP